MTETTKTSLTGLESTSEEGGSILEIRWRYQSLKGTMDVSWMPPKVTYFSVGWNGIAGTLDTVCLPRNLKHLYLDLNKFSGTVDWETMPPSIEYLDLSNNQFKGNVSLDVSSK